MKSENERLQKDLQKVQQEVTNGGSRNETSRSSDMSLDKRVSVFQSCQCLLMSVRMSDIDINSLSWDVVIWGYNLRLLIAFK